MHPLIDMIKHIRKSKHVSQSELGKRVGLPQSHISKIEKGQTDLRLSSLSEIVKHLDHELMIVPVSKRNEVRTLLGLENDTPPPAPSSAPSFPYVPPPSMHGPSNNENA